MTAHPDDLIRAFIADGRDELPDRAFDAVRGDIHRTRQRVVIGPWREPQMSNLAKVALAAAAVIAIAFGATRLLPTESGPGTVQTSPTPTPTATPDVTSAPSMSMVTPGPLCTPFCAKGELAPGTYSLQAADKTPVGLQFTVPAGWSTEEGFVSKRAGTPDEILFVTWIVSHVFADACLWQEDSLVPGGTTAAELTDALRSQLGRVASATTDIEVDGFPAKQTEFTYAEEVDLATCTQQATRLWPDAGPDFSGGFCCSPKDAIQDIRIVDVNGGRLVIVAQHQPDTSPAEIAELESIVASIRFDAVSAASPSP
jgi:hypothetical protein